MHVWIIIRQLYYSDKLLETVWTFDLSGISWLVVRPECWLCKSDISLQLIKCQRTFSSVFLLTGTHWLTQSINRCMKVILVKSMHQLWKLAMKQGQGLPTTPKSAMPETAKSTQAICGKLPWHRLTVSTLTEITIIVTMLFTVFSDNDPQS